MRRLALLSVLLVLGCLEPAPPPVAATIAPEVDPAAAPPLFVEVEVEVPAPEPSEPGLISPVTWEHLTVHTGDRVRLKSRSGTFKPAETGHPVEIEGDAGHTGAVLGGERREATSYFTPDPDEPIQIVRVRWDTQEWSEGTGAEPVTIESFDATVHLSYLEHAD